jgi:hypothetical protein
MALVRIRRALRGWGIKDPHDNPYDDFVAEIRAFNTAAYDWRLGVSASKKQLRRER